MISRQTQDNLQIFQGALEKGLLDWETFFHLDQDQRADAERLLKEKGYISETLEGNYEVSPGIRGIVPPSRAPAYFTNKKSAETLVQFYKEKNQQVSLTKR